MNPCRAVRAVMFNSDGISMKLSTVEFDPIQLRVGSRDSILSKFRYLGIDLELHSVNYCTDCIVH